MVMATVNKFCSSRLSCNAVCTLRLFTGLLTEQVGRGTVGPGRRRNPSCFLAKEEAWKEMAEGGIGARG